MDLQKLYGRWIAVQQCRIEATVSLVLQRPDPRAIDWGQQFILTADGAFEDIYKARCGNDPQIHHWIGAWQVLEVARSPLLLTYTVATDERQFWIEELSSETLTLVEILTSKAEVPGSLCFEQNENDRIRSCNPRFGN